MSRESDIYRINPNIKSLYVFLKRFDIEEFFLTKEFNISLMELNLDEHWDLFKKVAMREIGVAVLHPQYTGYVDKAFLYMLNAIYLNKKQSILGFLDHVLQEFISKKADVFNKEEFKQRLLDCDLEPNDIKNLRILKEDRNVDFKEILDKIQNIDLLPIGIDYKKMK